MVINQIANCYGRGKVTLFQNMKEISEKILLPRDDIIKCKNYIIKFDITPSSINECNDSKIEPLFRDKTIQCYTDESKT